MKQTSENKLFNLFSKSSWISRVKIICVIKFNLTRFESRSIQWVCYKDTIQNRSLWWASQFSSSESATKTLSMRWSIYSHRFTYQWIDLPRVSTSNSESATMIALFSHSESATIDISMIWKINRKIGRKTSVELYVSAMNYTTSHRNMTFKEKRVMLRSMSTLNKA